MKTPAGCHVAPPQERVEGSICGDRACILGWREPHFPIREQAAAPPFSPFFGHFFPNRYLVTIYCVLPGVIGEVGGCSCEQSKCLPSWRLRGGLQIVRG